MLKLFLILILCTFVLVECQPTQKVESHDEDHHRVARQTQQLAQNAIKAGGEMANIGLSAVNTGVETFTTAAQQAVTSGVAIFAQMIKKLAGMV